MKSWEQDLLSLVDDGKDEKKIFDKVQGAVEALGFEYWAYGHKSAWPLTKPRVHMVSNYPVAWKSRYDAAGYLQQDPTVAHCARSQSPIIWSDEVFRAAPELWRDAQAHGLCVGWAQSNFDPHGVGGMLTLARSAQPLSAEELQANEVRMRWLVNIAHLVLKPAPVQSPQVKQHLTDREVEVLKWTADGKTSSEIADILLLSIDTVNFHVKNAVSKLSVANKTAAVVRAVMLGLLV